MHALSLIAEFSTILDALALVSSLLVILFLMQNRRKYGGLLLNTAGNKDAARFTNEVSLQMMSQQSQKAYDNLQRSLTREFEGLRLMGEKSLQPSSSRQVSDATVGLTPSKSKRLQESRNSRYRMADEMIANGAGVKEIMQRCGLAEGELELLQGLQQLEQSVNVGSILSHHGFSRH